MIIRLFIIAVFSLLCGACDAGSNSHSSQDSFEDSLLSFSSAVSSGDISGFRSIAGSDEVYLVRKFTSGNLGGRGEELSGAYSVDSLTKDMEFLIEQQTPFSLRMLFPGFPLKNYKMLPQYKMPADICNVAFDRWGDELKKAISPLPQANEGGTVILTAAPDCWVYAEAQVIDEILVGGFAVFKSNADSLYLASIIELL